jgi:hypothetical protein
LSADPVVVAWYFTPPIVFAHANDGVLREMVGVSKFRRLAAGAEGRSAS